jgi:hypothetical protein
MVTRRTGSERSSGHPAAVTGKSFAPLSPDGVTLSRLALERRSGAQVSGDEIELDLHLPNSLVGAQ